VQPYLPSIGTGSLLRIFLSLSFTPTAVIGIDQKLEIPIFKFHSNTRPSLFDYPPEQQTKTDDAPEKVKTAVLSTTAQAKRRAQKKEKQQRRESMDVDQPAPSTPKMPADDRMETDESAVKDDVQKDGEPKEGEKDSAPAEGLKKKMEKEKVGYELENMSRVLPAQLKYLTFPDLRYEPVKRPTGGVILVIDTQPEAERETIELKASKVEAKPGPLAASGAEQTPQDNVNDPFAPQTPIAAGGAAAAAGVLTAVDEDEEGAEEAPVPGEFEYFSETEDAGDAE